MPPKLDKTNMGAFLMSKRKKHITKYSPEFKLSVTLDM